MNKVFGLISLFLMLLSLSQCSSKAESLPTATAVVSPIPVETTISTFAPTPTSSPTITVTPARTLTPAPSPTFAATNTLTDEEQATQFETIRELSTTSDPDCQFPCYWGITPGKTSWPEAKDFLSQNHIAFYEFEQASFFFGLGWQLFEIHAEKLGTEKVTFDIDFYVYKKIVQRIVDIRYYSGTPGINWRTTWATLSPEKIIQMLGKPSRVRIFRECYGIDPPEMNKCMYYLNVFYNTRGTFLKYWLSVNLIGSTIICPAFADGGNGRQWFELVLKTPEDPTIIERRGGGDQLGLSLEEATGMTLNDFYPFFLQAKNPPCFKIFVKNFLP